MGENYFDILGIGRDADDEAVKQAFRELAKTYHPDRNPGDAEAEQNFKLINTAYEALKDAHRRDAYIEWLHFAETRERSKAAQWGRLAALLAVLIFGPVLLYLALASTESPSPPSPSPTPVAGNTAPLAPPAPIAPAEHKPAPDQAMHTTPQPIPVTEASKTPPREAAPSEQPDPMTQTAPWKPQSESVTPATTPDTLPPNNADAGSQRIAKAGESDASPVDLLPPGGNETAMNDVVGGNFADCELCPRMTTASDPRYLAFKDRNGRLVSRESVAVSQAEITVAQWNACVAEGSCPRYVTASQPDLQRPVRNVSPRDASTFTDWLSRKSGHSYWVLADSRGEINPGAETENEGNCSAGWEWLEDGCHRRASTYVSFRVLRDLRASTD